jgi:hypothetical protein
MQLNRNPFHDVPRHLLLPPVVKSRGARIGMAGQMLHLFERDTRSRSFVFTATRNECGDNREGKEALLRRRFIMRQISLT